MANENTNEVMPLVSDSAGADTHPDVAEIAVPDDSDAGPGAVMTAKAERVAAKAAKAAEVASDGE